MLILNILSQGIPLFIELNSLLLQVDLLSDLYTLSPLIAILLAGISYLAITINKKDKIIANKDTELKELHQYIRESEKENLSTLKKVSSTLDRVIDIQKNSDNIVLKEIDNLKDIVLVKIKDTD